MNENERMVTLANHDAAIRQNRRPPMVVRRSSIL